MIADNMTLSVQKETMSIYTFGIKLVSVSNFATFATTTIKEAPYLVRLAQTGQTMAAGSVALVILLALI